VPVRKDPQQVLPLSDLQITMRSILSGKALSCSNSNHISISRRSRFITGLLTAFALALKTKRAAGATGLLLLNSRLGRARDMAIPMPTYRSAGVLTRSNVLLQERYECPGRRCQFASCCGWGHPRSAKSLQRSRCNRCVASASSACALPRKTRSAPKARSVNSRAILRDFSRPTIEG